MTKTTFTISTTGFAKHSAAAKKKPSSKPKTPKAPKAKIAKPKPTKVTSSAVAKAPKQAATKVKTRYFRAGEGETIHIPHLVVQANEKVIVDNGGQGRLVIDRQTVHKGGQLITRF